MRVWRVSYHTAHDGLLVSWHRSRWTAEQCLARCRAQHGPPQGVAVAELVEIPTDKDGLLDWLNANVQSDNG